MGTVEEKAAWVQRVLGLTVDAPAQATLAGIPSFVAIWREAKEQVDGGIGTLQDRMRKHPLAALGRIADAGLNGITDKVSVGMMAAMMEADRSGAKAAASAMKAVTGLRAFLATDAAAAIDENPFGIAVGLRSTFKNALEMIEKRLTA